eukprot:1038981-Prymnesium_polylepis.1
MVYAISSSFSLSGVRVAAVLISSVSDALVKGALIGSFHETLKLGRASELPSIPPSRSRCRGVCTSPLC